MAKSNPPVKIKICGMTNLDDARLAVENGADAVGFIFYKKSPRCVTEKTVKEINAQLPPFIHRVGVFVNETAERINRIAASCGLSAVQLHGDESPAFCRKIKSRVIKAVRVENAASLKNLSRYPVDGFLLDTFKKGQWGGTGQVFDWALAKRAKQYGAVIVAGGLNSRNVREAIRRVQPYGVDVSSGVERSPGIKDPKKIKAFLKAVREGQ
ncbi:MAG: phosphoribosylanthranilate isomerase [Nitrospinaceae bacterium]|nr:phosphoribosylanthranilate isomerase [Nitrospinaceae bacterium]NIR53301.1 phosphoribosylanthranilate isomerase [Nitrospinaceae bacterium]NIS83699.1 phosphoribosylanthranilate isomerase [Nitrospinaceae bacterium]NIT80495.1 phosphoribosylanthranilate isomerase [Nitrospinaceae bacterium]NIU42823.1 phosphoribosylanthranilate isomerase [Nitrospinaceae bacterium]